LLHRSGVLLGSSPATFSGLSRASAIDGVLKKTQTYEDSAADYEARYRERYMAFLPLPGFVYEPHADHESYFWQRENSSIAKGGTDTDAFISPCFGSKSTAGDLIFSPETFEGTLRWGVQS